MLWFSLNVRRRLWKWKFPLRILAPHCCKKNSLMKRGYNLLNSSISYSCCLQDHYDFGMRAVKTVISAAGNLKRENPDMSEVMKIACGVSSIDL